MRFSLRSLALVCVAMFLGLMGMALPVHAAVPGDDASRYIQGLADQAIATISDKSLSKPEKQTKLESIFSQNVDFPWVGRFVMGPFWRQATDAQKARYLREYQKFLILHYTSRFTNYTSGRAKVTGSRADGDDEFTVSMQLQSDEPNSQPVLVEYRVRKEAAGFKIFDVIVEGVSLITTQRSEFSSVLNNNGIDYLIEQLSVRSKAPEAQNG